MIDGVVNYLKSFGSVVVAYSGGVDSTLLLRLAKEAGIEYVGLIIDTPLIPRAELDFAINEAERLGLNYICYTVENDFLESIKNNPENRCYICKKYLFSNVVEYAIQHGFKYVLDGSNEDDKSDYRPGAVALKELEIKSPFAELGINKKNIREMAKSFGLNNWNFPARACLASRIVYGEEITVDKLSKIEMAEKYMDQLFDQMGIENVQYRIRVHGDIARLEVPSEVIEIFLDGSLRNEVSNEIKKCGFKFVALDLDGYRMGSLNEVLN